MTRTASPEIVAGGGERRTVRCGGVEIACEVAGTGPPLLCVQGVGVVGEGWRPQVDALSRRFRTITWDNRGIGATAAGSETLSIEAMASDVLGIMDAHRLDSAHLMGHSMGGLIALSAALRVPRRVKSLTLLCTFANGKDATALSMRMIVLGLRARVGTRRMRRNGMMRMIMPREYLRRVDRDALGRDLARLFGRDLADQPAIIGQQLAAMSRCSVADRLHELSGIPTLVVSAAHDPIAPPRLGKAIAAGIPGARYVEFPHAGHALPIQCAEECNALVLSHLTAAEAGSG
jgi:pimeloyl-ACP methyl ester carboxylesterase